MIEVFCDNPSHARRKVAKVETFARIRAFGGEWYVKAERIDAPNVDNYRKPDGQLRQNYKCKLCRRNWICGEEARFQRILDELVAVGVSRISIKDLAARK